MTTAQFITAIEAEPIFIKWVKAPASVIEKKVGDVELWHGLVYHTTPDGTNIFNVYFHVDTANNQATWQTFNPFTPEKNTASVKETALTNYLKANFAAFFVVRSDLVNNWAEADVFELSGQDYAKSKVLVFKPSGNPITHKKIL